jgi:hypothetical protein
MIDDYEVMLPMLGHPVHGPCIDFLFVCDTIWIKRASPPLALIWHSKISKKEPKTKKPIGCLLTPRIRPSRTLDQNGHPHQHGARRGLFVVLLFLAISRSPGVGGGGEQRNHFIN